MDLRGGAYVSRTVARTFTLPCVAVACDASAPIAANGEPRREGRRTAGADVCRAKERTFPELCHSAAASSCWARKLLLSSDSLPAAEPGFLPTTAKCLHPCPRAWVHPVPSRSASAPCRFLVHGGMSASDTVVNVLVWKHGQHSARVSTSYIALLPSHRWVKRVLQWDRPNRARSGRAKMTWDEQLVTFADGRRRAIGPKLHELHGETISLKLMHSAGWHVGR